jgi:uncharacterized membrane protein
MADIPKQLLSTDFWKNQSENINLFNVLLTFLPVIITIALIALLFKCILYLNNFFYRSFIIFEENNENFRNSTNVE